MRVDDGAGASGPTCTRPRRADVFRRRRCGGRVLPWARTRRRLRAAQRGNSRPASVSAGRSDLSRLTRHHRLAGIDDSSTISLDRSSSTRSERPPGRRRSWHRGRRRQIGTAAVVAVAPGAASVAPAVRRRRWSLEPRDVIGAEVNHRDFPPAAASPSGRTRPADGDRDESQSGLRRHPISDHVHLSGRIAANRVVVQHVAPGGRRRSARRFRRSPTECVRAGGVGGRSVSDPPKTSVRSTVRRRSPPWYPRQTRIGAAGRPRHQDSAVRDWGCLWYPRRN